MRRTGRRGARGVFRLALALSVVILGLSLVGVTMAKYASGASGGDSAKVAVFAPALSTESNINFSSVKKPGDSETVHFTVQNTTGETVSEVAMRYRITLRTTGNLPLVFTLTDGDSTVAEWDCNGKSGEQTFTCLETALASMLFDAGTKEARAYQLTAEWKNDSDRNGAVFAGLTDAVCVSVEWEQVD